MDMLVILGLILDEYAQITVAKSPYGEKTRPGQCFERQLIAQRPSMINEAREVLCQRRFPASLIYGAYCEPIARCPVDFYAAALS